MGYMKYVQGKSLADAFNKALVKLDKEGEIIPCEDYSTQYKEIVQLSCPMTIDVEDVNHERCLTKAMIGSYDDLQGYLLEFIYGYRNYCVDIYQKGKNKDFWPYTYNQRFSDQVDWLIDTLIFNKESRRAVLQVRDKEVDMNNNDPACLQSMQFQIVNNNLNMFSYMRSNDAMGASAMNLFAFTEFQKYLVEQIKKRAIEYIDILQEEKKNYTTPEEKDEINATINYLKTFKKLKAKHYTHTAYSFHAYGQVLNREEFSKYLEETQGISLDKLLENSFYEFYHQSKEDAISKGMSIEKYSDNALNAAIRLGYIVSYGKNKFVVEGIYRLKNNAKKIKENTVEQMSLPYKKPREDYPFTWYDEMVKSTYDVIIDKCIKVAVKYDEFTIDLIDRINTILDEYNLDENELEYRCYQKGIDYNYIATQCLKDHYAKVYKK